MDTILYQTLSITHMADQSIEMHTEPKRFFLVRDGTIFTSKNIQSVE
ncbi:unnamed protein product [Larinioides sclopetarius]|uniref:Uncharacterized protein n=1 Tax=Larinioides sclopetarius TaxID=280406 RepID=A0AAV2AMF1_9ARAC